jgi:5-formyltetrahydrofolate cyclo-ligase
VFESIVKMKEYKGNSLGFTEINPQWGKQELRKALILKRGNIENRTEKSAAVHRKFSEKAYYKAARNIMAYSSVKSEVETGPLIEKMLSDGKTVILPVSVPETKEIIPVKIESAEELRKGTYGISEPVKKNQIFNKNTIDLIIVPAVAYDAENYRIGYGAGYYDRFLKDFKGLKIGFCFDELFYNGKFPITVWDIPVDEVIIADS